MNSLIPMEVETTRLSDAQKRKIFEETGLPLRWLGYLTFERADKPKNGEAYKIINRFYYGNEEERKQLKRKIVAKVAEQIKNTRVIDAPV